MNIRYSIEKQKIGSRNVDICELFFEMNNYNPDVITWKSILDFCNRREICAKDAYLIMEAVSRVLINDFGKTIMKKSPRNRLKYFFDNYDFSNEPKKYIDYNRWLLNIDKTEKMLRNTDYLVYMNDSFVNSFEWSGLSTFDILNIEEADIFIDGNSVTIKGVKFDGAGFVRAIEKLIETRKNSKSLFLLKKLSTFKIRVDFLERNDLDVQIYTMPVRDLVLSGKIYKYSENPWKLQDKFADLYIDRMCKIMY